MSRSNYDIVYLTNTPSFYKLNLMDRVAKEGRSVLMVFYGYGPEAVNASLEANNSIWHFDSVFLHHGYNAERSKLKCFFRLIKLMGSIKAKRVIFSGWLTPEYNIYSIFSPRRRNAVIVESTIHESKTTGYKGWLKNLFLKRMSLALPSGTPHIKLIQQLGYKGDYNITGSVGIINKEGLRPAHKLAGNPKCIFTGRLTGVKNLKFLIEQFNRLGLPLTIVGKGELEAELKSIAKSNITFKGFVDNHGLAELYKNHDIFILPSVSETWGLVVDEALYWGLPVVVSDRVGSGDDLVRALGTGQVFTLGDSADFERALRDVVENYETYATNVAAIDFEERDKKQIQAYL